MIMKLTTIDAAGLTRTDTATLRDVAIDPYHDLEIGIETPAGHTVLMTLTPFMARGLAVQLDTLADRADVLHVETHKKLATYRIMESLWTLEYLDNGDGRAHVLKYDRLNPEGYAHEKELPLVQLKESKDGNRTIVSFKITPYDRRIASFGDQFPHDATEFIVSNPLNIFSYS